MTVGRRTPALALSPFMAAIRARLLEMSADDVRAAVEELARSLEPGQRQDFLDTFGAAASPAVDEVSALSEAIEVLEEAASATDEPGWDETDEWHDRYGWSLDDELAEPDWAPELLALLRSTGALFVTGDASNAASAYGRLLRVTVGAIDNGWSLASARDDTDVLREATARYLWALRAVTAPADRCGVTFNRPGE